VDVQRRREGYETDPEIKTAVEMKIEPLVRDIRRDAPLLKNMQTLLADLTAEHEKLRGSFILPAQWFYAQADYASRASVAAGDTTNQFVVTFSLERVPVSGPAVPLSAPTLKVLAGQEGEMTIESGDESFIFKAHIKDVHGKRFGRANVSIVSGGRETWSDAHVLDAAPGN
jgi:hypothetical protein